MKNTLIVATIVFVAAILIAPGMPELVTAHAAAPELRVRPQRTEMGVPAIAIRLRRVSARYVFDAELNGNGPWRFVVDLANRRTLLDDNLITALKLKSTATPGVRNDDGTTETANVVSIDSLKIGEAAFINFDAVVVDLDALAGGGRAYDGVLGFSLFAKLVLIMDHTGGRMILRKGSVGPVDGKKVFDLVADAHGIAVSMSLSGTTTNVTLDSMSAGAFALPSSMEPKVEVAPRITGDFVQQKPITALDLDAKEIRGAVKIGKFRLIDPPVVFDAHRPMVGLEVLDRFTLSIDQTRRRIEFERLSGDTVGFPLRTRWGIAFVRQGTQLKVLKIMPGSLAERSVIKEGDLVTSFMGQSLNRLTDADIVALLRQRDQTHMTILRSGVPLMVSLDQQ